MGREEKKEPSVPTRIRISVVKRSEQLYHASIGDEPRNWEVGRTAAEAIGALIVSHQEKFGITLTHL
jgi:hypothetical protein